MPIRPKQYVPQTTQEEADLAAKARCTVCNRGFLNKAGVKSHMQFCRGSVEAELANPRGRIGQKIDNKIKNRKREILIKNNDKIEYNGKPICSVFQTKYLGAVLMSYGGDEEEVVARIDKSEGSFNAHWHIWKNNKLSIRFKIKLLTVRILSALTYGCESWKVTKRIMQNVRGFTSRCIAKILNIQYVEMSVVVKYVDIIEMIEKVRWKWLGHVIRMDSSRNPNRCLSILDYSPGSLLAHLNFYMRDLRMRDLLASNRTEWITKTFQRRIKLNAQCP